jgi:hypothetical protein
MRLKKYIVAVLAVGLIGLLLPFGTVQAQVLEFDLVGVGANAGATGELRIEGDKLTIKVQDAVPDESFNVLLGQSATANRTPMSFIGHFTTNSIGKGEYKLKGFDVTTAFETFATGETDPDNVTGLVVCQAGAADPDENCNVVQLNALRIYFADPIGGVTRAFDGDGASGGLAFGGVLFDTSD